ncbi:hypothetical protein Agabi119p4_1158 [Agaricus bisporus var. burnettii]|uniref:Uncharacterized protein n=1 Tax=Agaricus bisporus var. burnettii TaxID=192524 RepID=A0A8H7FBW3_AGABI|nr:hypothetical protein Agabi119p4_1158 [Agaricus bisporus var. burnettii]
MLNLLRHPSKAGLKVASAVNREESWPTGTRNSSAIMRSVNRNFQWLSSISGEFQVNFRHIEKSYSQAMFMACSCFVQEAFSRFHAVFMRCSWDVRINQVKFNIAQARLRHQLGAVRQIAVNSNTN